MTRAEELADAAMGGPDDPLTAEQIAAISELAADAEALAEALEETSDLLRRRDLGKGRRESVAGWEWAVLQTHVDAALARYRGEKP